MKTLITALTLGTLIAAPAFVHSASAAPPSDGLDAARARAIQECSAMQKQYPNQYHGGASHHHYRACMADHGQPE
jgi:hypothetical protein